MEAYKTENFNICWITFTNISWSIYQFKYLMHLALVYHNKLWDNEERNSKDDNKHFELVKEQ